MLRIRLLIQKSWLALILWLLLRLAPIPAAAGETPRYFFYYDPDSPQINLASLKEAMDDLLAGSQQDILFQPFAHFPDFDRNVTARQPAFLLLPPWYLDLRGVFLDLKPLLRPLREGKSAYDKLLLARQEQDNKKRIPAPRSLATTLMGPRSSVRAKTWLLFDALNLDLDRLNIVFVPKGTDALFALTLGQVDLALVAATTYDFLAQRTPSLVKGVKILKRSKPVPLPILCYAETKVSKEEAKRFDALFLQRRASGLYRRLMEMLNFDGWEKAH